MLIPGIPFPEKSQKECDQRGVDECLLFWLVLVLRIGPGVMVTQPIFVDFFWTITIKSELLAELCISQFQAPTSPLGDPWGFALYCCPGARIYTWWPSPGAGFLHIHKITFSTVKKYTFTQLAFGSYLHALHRQFRLSILAWLNTKILK